MADYIPDIRTLLPQGPPFIMIDRVLGFDGRVTRTAFLVAAENPLSGDGRFSVGGLIENLAQTAAAGAGMENVGAGKGVESVGAGMEIVGAGESRRGGAIVSINRLEVRELPAVGDELVTETVVTTRVGDIIVISGKISRGQSIVAAVEMKILAGV